MMWINGIEHLKTKISSSVVTIGNFDGVHLGHRQVVEKLRLQGNKHQAPMVVLTFDPHPIKALYPEREIQRIFDLQDQKEQLSELGISILVVEPFSRAFSEVSPEIFLQKWIVEPFSPKAIVVGYDFCFGANRKGNAELMRSFCHQYGIEVEVSEAYRHQGEVVSSSQIRKLLKEGDIAKVNQFLGRRFYLKGIVERGEGRGRTIGFPTANLRHLGEMVPLRGVYAGRTFVRGQWYASMTNIGFNPTFKENESQLKIETHILDFNQDIYGDTIKTELTSYLREEKRFSRVEELIMQLQEDKTACRRIYNG